MAGISGVGGVTFTGTPLSPNVQLNDLTGTSFPDDLPKESAVPPGVSGAKQLVAFNLGDGEKLLRLIQRSSNNIQPFLRGVSKLPAEQRAWIVEKAIGLVGGTTKFLNLLKSFAPAAGFVAKFAGTKLNPVLLAYGVLDELDQWFGRGVGDATLPVREPARPRPQIEPPITPLDFPYQPPSGKPYPLYAKPLTPVKPAESTIRIPTEDQITAEYKLKDAQSDLARAKEAVDQAFARPPVLGLKGFRDNVATLATAVEAYDKAIAAAKAVGLENVQKLIQQLQRTAAQALDLLARAPQRAAKLKAAEDNRAANPYPDNNAPNLGKLDEVVREINYGSLQRFFSYAGGVSGLVQKGLIKTPADFAKLFGQKMFQQEDLNIFSKSLQNFIANPGRADKALAKAAQFLMGCIQAYKDPLLSFRFPEPDELEKAGKPESPLLNPKKDPLIGPPKVGSPIDPFKRPVDDEAPKLPNSSPKRDDQNPKEKPLTNPIPPLTEKPVGEPGTSNPSDLRPSASGTGSADDGATPNPEQPPDAATSAAPTDGSASSSRESPNTPSPAESFLAKRLQEAAPEGSRLFEQLKAEGWKFSVSHGKPYAVAPSGNAYPPGADALPTVVKNFNRGFTQSWKTTIQQNLDKALKAEAGEIRWPGPGNVIKLEPKPGK